MTMFKRETNNIWARVRDDVDVDDLIFSHENEHNDQNNDTCSQR